MTYFQFIALIVTGSFFAISVLRLVLGKQPRGVMLAATTVWFLSFLFILSPNLAKKEPVTIPRGCAKHPSVSSTYVESRGRLHQGSFRHSRDRRTQRSACFLPGSSPINLHYNGPDGARFGGTGSDKAEETTLRGSSCRCPLFEA